MYNLAVDQVDDSGKSILYKGKLELAVFAPPASPPKIIYDQCDVDQNSLDGITLFNLNTKLSEITTNNKGLEVTYFASVKDFENDEPITNPSEYISASNPNIILKITDKESNCFSIGAMEINAYPTSLDIYESHYICENDLGNGTQYSIDSSVAPFDFEVKRATIKNIFSNYDIVVEFYESLNNLQLQTNPISGTKTFPDSEIFVRISNKDNNNCISAGKFNLVINKIPLPNYVNKEIILCIGNIEDAPQIYTVELDGNTNIKGDQYQWYFNNMPIINAKNPVHFAEKEGVYEVKVLRNYENNTSITSDNSACEGFSIFNVKESNIPVLYSEDITIQDDSSNNTITINTDNLGIGAYEFALNNSNGNYQGEPFFENVPAGIHKIYVKDKNGCGFTALEVSVIGFPKFFTPNNDGINDTWRIPGVNNDFYPTSNIYIFDRFGKVITSLNPNEKGWDGTLNGKYLPSTDYWYSVELTDKQGNIRVKKGHFSLIRR